MPMLFNTRRCFPAPFSAAPIRLIYSPLIPENDFLHMQALMKDNSLLKFFIYFLAGLTNRPVNVIAIGSLLLAFVWLSIGTGASYFCNTTGFFYPAYRTFKILWFGLYNDEYEQFKIYWLIYGTSIAVELLLESISKEETPFPFYWLLKCLFLAWCMIPDEHNGTRYVKDAIRQGCKPCVKYFNILRMRYNEKIEQLMQVKGVMKGKKEEPTKVDAETTTDSDLTGTMIVDSIKQQEDTLADAESITSVESSKETESMETESIDLSKEATTDERKSREDEKRKHHGDARYKKDERSKREGKRKTAGKEEKRSHRDKTSKDKREKMIELEDSIEDKDEKTEDSVDQRRSKDKTKSKKEKSESERSERKEHGKDKTKSHKDKKKSSSKEKKHKKH